MIPKGDKIMENEVINVAEEEVVNDVCTNEDLKNNKIGKAIVIALGVGALATGITVAIRKNKGKLKAMRVKKMVKRLEKEGYTVLDNSIGELDEDVEVNPTEE